MLTNPSYGYAHFGQFGTYGGERSTSINVDLSNLLSREDPEAADLEQKLQTAQTMTYIAGGLAALAVLAFVMKK